MLLTGFLRFSQDLLCLKEVLGAEIDIEIGGISARIVFPQLVEKWDESGKFELGFLNPLAAPRGAEKWKKGGRPLEWGYPMSFPEVLSTISQAVIYVECSDDNLQSTADVLYSKIGDWEGSFFEYCNIASKQYSLRNLNLRTFRSDFQLYEKDYVTQSFPIKVYASVPKESNALSLSIIKDACKYASSEKELFLEYQMLNVAYAAKANCQNRQAIIDACSALEIVMVKQISQYCDSISLDSNILLSKYRSLGDRVKLVQNLFPNFTIERLNEQIVFVRNNIAHNKTVFPTDEETDNLIQAVEMCMEHFFDGYY